MFVPMGEMVEFASNGATASGYLASPESGSGPGVLVIQEWWGLVPHIKDVCERFAAEGFLALAPDLYHGQTAREPDGAGKLMMALNLTDAGKDMSGAIDLLRQRSGRDAIGVVGFCMGGGLALVEGTLRPDAVKAVVAFYGVIPWPSAQPDWSQLSASVRGHIAEKDAFFTPEKAQELEGELKGMGKDVQFFVYPDVDHAFFNDTRPEVHDKLSSDLAWQRTVEHLRSALG
jgi:carboxymethylenebutenolidase